MRRRSAGLAALGVAVALGAGGCMPGPGPQPALGPAAPELPSGFGTLRQDDITVALRVGPLQLRVTPLEPTLIRLTAPDTEDRLAALLGGVDGDAGLWVLVSVQTEAAGGAAFEPMAVEVSSGGVVHRPLQVRGLTPRWGSGQLEQRVAQQALYLFAGDVDPWLAFEVRVGDVLVTTWNARLPLLDAERARVLARARIDAGAPGR